MTSANDVDKQKLKEYVEKNKAQIQANAKKIEQALQRKIVYPTANK